MDKKSVLVSFVSVHPPFWAFGRWDVALWVRFFFTEDSMLGRALAQVGGQPGSVRQDQRLLEVHHKYLIEDGLRWTYHWPDACR